MQILHSGSARLDRLVFSHDGRFLGAGAHGSFHLWEPNASIYPLWSIRSISLSKNFVFTADGKFLIGGGSKVGMSDVRTGAWREMPFPQYKFPSKFTPDGRFAVNNDCPRGDWSARLWMARATPGGWVEAWQKDLPPAPVEVRGLYRPVLFSIDGARLLQWRVSDQGDENATPYGVDVLDTETGTQIGEWQGELPALVHGGSANASGLFVMFDERTIYVIDTTVPDSKPIERPNPANDRLTDAEFSRDGSRLATTSDTTATIWDTTTWEPLRNYEWEIGCLRSVCFAPDGLRCAAGSETGQIVVWDLDE